VATIASEVMENAEGHGMEKTSPVSLV